MVARWRSAFGRPTLRSEKISIRLAGAGDASCHLPISKNGSIALQMLSIQMYWRAASLTAPFLSFALALAHFGEVPDCLTEHEADSRWDTLAWTPHR